MQCTLAKTKKDLEIVKGLYKALIDTASWDHDKHTHWLARRGEDVVGFYSAKKIAGENGAYYSAAGVVDDFRGLGVQREFIHRRDRWARRSGFSFAVTYTSYCNNHSIVNLLKSGFGIYSPDNKWAGRDWLYFYKDLRRLHDGKPS